jgi:hypothetical protein
MAAGDWHVVMNYPAVDRFLYGPVLTEFAMAIGPRIKRSAKGMVPRRRGAALFRSLDWSKGMEAAGAYVKVGGNIYDMDIEAPADQFLREHPKALKVSLFEVLSELEPIWGTR